MCLICAEAQELVLKDVAASIPSHDSQDLPVLELVKEGVARNADFAHEQLIDVVGACQFFASFPSFSALESPSDMRYHFTARFKTAENALMIS